MNCIHEKKTTTTVDLQLLSQSYFLKEFYKQQLVVLFIKPPPPPPPCLCPTKHILTYLMSAMVQPVSVSQPRHRVKRTYEGMQLFGTEKCTQSTNLNIWDYKNTLYGHLKAGGRLTDMAINTNLTVVIPSQSLKRLKLVQQLSKVCGANYIHSVLQGAMKLGIHD